jgi:hypothetical protein
MRYCRATSSRPAISWPGRVGAECSREPGDCLSYGLIADVIRKPGAGDARRYHVGGGANGGQAFLDLDGGGSGARGKAQAGQLGAVDDIDVQMQVNRHTMKSVEGGGDRGRVGGHAADLAQSQRGDRLGHVGWDREGRDVLVEVSYPLRLTLGIWPLTAA